MSSLSMFLYLLYHVFLFLFSPKAPRLITRDYKITMFTSFIQPHTKIALKTRSYLKWPHHEGNKKISFSTALLNNLVSGEY